MKKAKTNFPNRHIHGFTLVELVITLTILAVLAAVAVPAMGTYIKDSRVTAASQELLRSVQTARTESTRRQTNVVLCLSPNPTGTAPRCQLLDTEDFRAAGWIIFVDSDNNWQRKLTVPAEELLEVHTFDSSKLTLAGNNSSRVSYSATGFATVNGSAFPQQNSTAFVIVDSRGNVDASGATAGPSVARAINVATTGRASITRSILNISGYCSDAGISC